MPSPFVAIVILNWNGKHYLEQFLPSVLTTSYPNFKLFIADNASTDNSLAFLKAAFPAIEIIALEKNFGFAQGYNEAIKNVTADWLQPIVQLLETNESYAACQPKIKSFKSKSMFEYAGAGGGWLDAYGYPFARGRIFDICEEDKSQYNTTEEVFWATGAAMVIKSNVFHQLHGFDEYFFAHQEEIDLCWRMQLAGYKIFCCPESVVYHVGGGTLPRGNSKKTYLNFRNNQIMLAKNLPWREKWWKIPYRIVLDQVSAFKGLVSGDAGYFLSIAEAHLAFLYWIFFGKRKWKLSKRHSLKKLSGVYDGNVAWQHFGLKKKKFSDFVFNKKTTT
ncbi:MAG: glycosyltransferase [Bacteroidota bacterium]|nr:glycosyltransferase [Bacteroidota bacterium]